MFAFFEKSILAKLNSVIFIMISILTLGCSGISKNHPGNLDNYSPIKLIELVNSSKNSTLKILSLNPYRTKEFIDEYKNVQEKLVEFIVQGKLPFEKSEQYLLLEKVSFHRTGANVEDYDFAYRSLVYSFPEDKVLGFLIDSSQKGEIVNLDISSNQYFFKDGKEMLKTSFPKLEIDTLFFRKGVFNLLIVNRIDQQKDYWITNEPTLELLDLNITEDLTALQKSRLAWLNKIQNCFFSTGKGAPF